MEYAIMLSVMAGLATGVGGMVVLMVPKIGNRSLGVSMGFAAGVMLTVALADMLPHVTEEYQQWMPKGKAGIAAASLCVVGIVAALALQRLLPDPQLLLHGGQRCTDVAKTALVVAVALAAHNLPEGMLTLLGGMENPAFGLRMALAVALHNIPEGIAVSVPMAYALHSKWKGAGWAFISGLAEPMGAILTLLVFRGVLNQGIINGSIAFVAGIMSGVSAGELLPGGMDSGGKNAAIIGFALGCGVMLIGISVLE